jgi:hypothetical protein
LSKPAVYIILSEKIWKMGKTNLLFNMVSLALKFLLNLKYDFALILKWKFIVRMNIHISLFNKW